MKKTHLETFGTQPQFHAQNLQAEMAQLQETRQQASPYSLMQSLPSPSTHPSTPPTSCILSVVCGSRGWIWEIPRKNPGWHLHTIDESGVLLEYARAHEWLEGIDDAEGKLGQLLESLKTIPNGTFDLVHLSYVANYTPTSAFPALLQALGRVVRAGGILRWEEGELPCTTSVSIEQLVMLTLCALENAGRGFPRLGCTPDARNLSITLNMRNGLLSAGCQRIQHVPVVIPVSARTTTYLPFCSRMRWLAQQMQPLLVQAGELTNEEFQELYTQMSKELQNSLFHGTCFLHTFWGKKGA